MFRPGLWCFFLLWMATASCTVDVVMVRMIVSHLQAPPLYFCPCTQADQDALRGLLSALSHPDCSEFMDLLLAQLWSPLFPLWQGAVQLLEVVCPRFAPLGGALATSHVESIVDAVPGASTLASGVLDYAYSVLSFCALPPTRTFEKGAWGPLPRLICL